MDKKILFLILLGALVLPLTSSAQLHSYGTTSVSLSSIVISVENATAMVFGAIVVICFVMAGVLFLTAQGEPEKVKTARAAFLWGIAGVIVGILAFSIIAIVGGFI